MTEIKKVTFGKLVRDNMLEIITADGLVPECSTLSPADRLQHLRAKVLEEYGEYLRSFDTKELADVFQALVSLAEEEGMDEFVLSEMAKDKRELRGAFEDGLYLESVGFLA